MSDPLISFSNWTFSDGINRAIKCGSTLRITFSGVSAPQCNNLRSDGSSSYWGTVQSINGTYDLTLDCVVGGAYIASGLFTVYSTAAARVWTASPCVGVGSVAVNAMYLQVNIGNPPCGITVVANLQSSYDALRNSVFSASSTSAANLYDGVSLSSSNTQYDSSGRIRAGWGGSATLTILCQ